MPVVFFGFAANPVLIAAQRQGPRIRQLILEYFFWTSWCVIYLYQFMLEVKLSVRAVKQAYAGNPFEMLKSHAAKFLQLTRDGFHKAKSKIRLTQCIIERVKIFLMISEIQGVTNEVMSEINFISRNLNDILAHIKFGIRTFERINRQEQLFHHRYIIVNRRNRRRTVNEPPQPRQVSRSRRRRVVQDENSALTQESSMNP